MQHALKSPSGATWAQVVAAEFLDELDIAMDKPLAALDVGFGWVGDSPLTGDLESRGDSRYRDACS
jgi:hypothetical protein